MENKTFAFKIQIKNCFKILELTCYEKERRKKEMTKKNVSHVELTQCENKNKQTKNEK